MLELSPEHRALVRSASRAPMLASQDRSQHTMLGRSDIEALLPQRQPFLFLDRVTFVDRSAPMIVCRYDLAGSESIFGGHFPGRPVWPGVLQVEAIGQAGLCLARLIAGDGAGNEPPSFALTHILAAEFSRPVTPGGEMEIICRLLPDGLFHILVGQCLQQNEICCAAAVRGLTGEMQK
jgi:3-hydroxyacyl-[acyl-carrier-protein] dehydratase